MSRGRNCSEFLPTDAYSMGYRLRVFEHNGLYATYAYAVLRDPNGEIAKEWDYAPNLTEVMEACQVLLVK